MGNQAWLRQRNREYTFIQQIVAVKQLDNKFFFMLAELLDDGDRPGRDWKFLVHTIVGRNAGPDHNLRTF